MRQTILGVLLLLLITGYVHADNNYIKINPKDFLKKIDLSRLSEEKQESIREQLIAALTGLRKIGANGDILPASSENWECVYDVNSKLMWEVKKDDSRERRSTWGAKYTNDTNAPDGESPTAVGKCDVYDEPGDCERPENIAMCQKSDRCGYCEDQMPSNFPPSCRDNDASWPNNPLCKFNHLYYSDLCRTDAYVDYINNEVRLCGFDDWRMPTREEIRSMSSHGRDEDLFRNSTYFPHGSKYHTLWSGETADHGNGMAWLVYPDNFSLQEVPRGDPNPVRLVRGQMEMD